MTRYFKVIDDEIIDGLIKNEERNKQVRALATKWAKDNGFSGEVLFYLKNLVGTRVDSLVVDRSTPAELLAKCRKPKYPKGHHQRTTTPKKSADKELYKSYHDMVAAANAISTNVYDLIGFDEFSFFPSSVGYSMRFETRSVFWLVPDSVKEVKGCVEVTNVEFIAWKESKLTTEQGK